MIEECNEYVFETIKEFDPKVTLIWSKYKADYIYKEKFPFCSIELTEIVPEEIDSVFKVDSAEVEFVYDLELYAVSQSRLNLFLENSIKSGNIYDLKRHDKKNNLYNLICWSGKFVVSRLNKIPEECEFRVKTIKRSDDSNNYLQNSIDHVILGINNALKEVEKRFDDNETLEVSVSRVNRGNSNV